MPSDNLKIALERPLFLWIGLVSAGRAIAYYDVPAELVPVYSAR